MKTEFEIVLIPLIRKILPDTIANEIIHTQPMTDSMLLPRPKYTISEDNPKILSYTGFLRQETVAWCIEHHVRCNGMIGVLDFPNEELVEIFLMRWA